MGKETQPKRKPANYIVIGDYTIYQPENNRVRIEHIEECLFAGQLGETFREHF